MEVKIKKNNEFNMTKILGINLSTGTGYLSGKEVQAKLPTIESLFQNHGINFDENTSEVSVDRALGVHVLSAGQEYNIQNPTLVDTVLNILQNSEASNFSAHPTYAALPKNSPKSPYDSDSDSGSLASASQSIKERLGELTTENIQLSETLEQKRKELKSLQNNLKEANQVIANKNQQIQDLQNQLNTTQSKSAKLENQLAALHQEHEDLKVKKDDLQQGLHSFSDENVELHNKAAEQEKTIDSLQTEIEQLKRSQSNLRRQNGSREAKLRTQLSNIRDLENEIAQLTQQVQSKKQTIAYLEEELNVIGPFAFDQQNRADNQAELAHELELENKQLQEKIRNLKLRLFSQNERLQKAQEETEKTRAKLGVIPELQNRIQRLQDNIHLAKLHAAQQRQLPQEPSEELVAALNEKDNQITALHKELTDSQRKQRQAVVAARVDTRIKQLQKEHQKELQELHAREKSHKTTIRNLREKTQQLRTREKRLKETLSKQEDVTIELVQQEKQIESLNAALKDKESELENITQEKEDLESLRAKNTVDQNSIQKKHAQKIKKLENEVKRLRELLERAGILGLELADENERLTAEINNLTQKYRTLQLAFPNLTE